MRLTVITPCADILGNPQEPAIISNADSQLLFGETFDVEKSHGAYVYGTSTIDGYKGYVERDQLVKSPLLTNAVITVPLTHLYPEASFKTRPVMPLSFFSRVSLNGEMQDGFAQTFDGEWIFGDHVQEIKALTINKDLADIVLGFLQTPYLYGGRSRFGLDCSGLVQLALLGKGVPTPARDSIDQSRTVGEEIKKADLTRNDLVFFEGHVAIMIDDENAINATARHMTTLIEPLADLEKAYGGITAIRRVC